MAIATRGPRTAPRAGRTRTVLVAACLAVLAARLVFLTQPLRADEGGYLYLARHWRAGGEFLYGDHHVDRPPLLLAIYRVAALWEWDGAVRLLAVPFALAAVLATARAGFLVAGEAGARWSAVVAAALVSSPALAADQADGALFAVPFVAGSAALALECRRRPPGPARWWSAVAAGALAGAAMLVKQSFLEGVLFGALLVTVEVVRRRRPTGPGAVLAAGGLAGLLLALAVGLVWGVPGPADPARVWREVLVFRADALAVIGTQSLDSPGRRAGLLVVLALVSAMVPMLWSHLGRCHGDRWRLSPVDWAVTGSLGYGVLAVVAGGSYWPHYLLQPAPMLALAAGTVAAGGSAVAARMRRWPRVAAGSAVLAVAASAVVYATVPWVWFHQRTGDWLAASSAHGDTAVVAYGAPSVLEAADLPTPYPYLWSLPMRTLDPGLARLRATLAGPAAPTWIVQLHPLDSWGLDRDGRLRRLVEARYDVVAEVCGNPVWLRSGTARTPAEPPRC